MDSFTKTVRCFSPCESFDIHPTYKIRRLQPPHGPGCCGRAMKVMDLNFNGIFSCRLESRSNLFQLCLFRIVLNELNWVSSLSKQFSGVLRCIVQAHRSGTGQLRLNLSQNWFHPPNQPRILNRSTISSKGCSCGLQSGCGTSFSHNMKMHHTKVRYSNIYNNIDTPNITSWRCSKLQ